MEAHVERPEAQRRVEGLSPTQALKTLFVLMSLPFIDGFLLACEPFDRKFRTIRNVRFRENIADTIANRAFA